MSNRLKSESSPYLLQHSENPVEWYSWCEEAFEKAKQEDKPIFLSIGYSTCHWCHVMAHESFESEEIGGESGFVRNIEKLGFKLLRKVSEMKASTVDAQNVDNTHFGLFFFKKVKAVSRKKAAGIPSLKACLYKKR